MWRLGRKLSSSVKNKRVGGRNILRNASTNNGSDGSQLTKLSVGIAVSGTLAFIGYAKADEEFRKTIEYSAPFIKPVFNTLLGPLSHEAKPNTTSQTVNNVQIDLPAKLKLPEPPISFVPEETIAVGSGEEDIIQKQEHLIEQTVASPELIENNVPSAAPAELNGKDGFLLQEDVNKVGEEMQTKEQIEANLQSGEEECKAEKTFEPEADFTASTPQRSENEVQLRLYELEEDVVADAAASKAIVEEELASCAHSCIESITSIKEAQEAISLHTKLIHVAMDNKNDMSAKEKSQQWEDVTQVLEQKTRLEIVATTSYEQARGKILKLEQILKEVKTQNHENLHELIIHAEDNLNKMTQELQEAAQKVDNLRMESRVLLQYQELAEQAKEHFRKEMLSMMPDVTVKPGWRGLSNKLSEDDLNALIAHAHRRIDQLQRELSEERSLSFKRVEDAVAAARELIISQAERDANHMVEQQQREREIELHKKLHKERQTYESEMRLQLKRQAAAHSEHLADVLALRDKQLQKQHTEEVRRRLAEQQSELEVAIETQREIFEQQLHDDFDNYQLSLSRAFARLTAIETVIDGRAHIENESRKAQELWLACEALRVALKYGKSGRPVALKNELTAITQVYEQDSSLVAVATAFPNESQERGVFTEDTIRSSFNKVSKLCKRLSMVNKERNSLFTYFLSYLKSLLIVSYAQEEPPSVLVSDQLDDTFKIISYARFCMEHGKVEQATRFMNQLKGEPKRVAEGWLNEARLYLETQQAVTALLHMASAINIATNLEE